MVAGGLVLVALAIVLLFATPSLRNAALLLGGIVTMLSAIPEALLLSTRARAVRRVRLAGALLCVPLIVVLVLSFVYG